MGLKYKMTLDMKMERLKTRGSNLNLQSLLLVWSSFQKKKLKITTIVMQRTGVSEQRFQATKKAMSPRSTTDMSLLATLSAQARKRIQSQALAVGQKTARVWENPKATQENVTVYKKLIAKKEW